MNLKLKEYIIKQFKTLKGSPQKISNELKELIDDHYRIQYNKYFTNGIDTTELFLSHHSLLILIRDLELIEDKKLLLFQMLTFEKITEDDYIQKLSELNNLYTF